MTCLLVYVSTHIIIIFTDCMWSPIELSQLPVKICLIKSTFHFSTVSMFSAYLYNYLYIYMCICILYMVFKDMLAYACNVESVVVMFVQDQFAVWDCSTYYTYGSLCMHIHTCQIMYKERIACAPLTLGPCTA